MGIDALDIMFRLEKKFAIRIPRGRIFWSSEQRQLKQLSMKQTVTVGEVHQRICELLAEMKLPVPDDSWNRVIECVGGALSIPPKNIRPEDRLIEDLGAT
jgi:acyl carrier protein